MANVIWRNVFPSTFSFIIFIVYICLFVNQGILVTASQQSNNQYDYNIVTVVLFTEILKLLISSALYCRENSPLKLVSEIQEHKKVLALYLVPAVLYCLYNNLSFLNLSSFDPTTYYLLLQLRVVVTGILFQCIFSKKLSRKQWCSLLILTFGCMLKQVNFTPTDNQEQGGVGLLIYGIFGMRAILISIQIICSCLAGVYNEYLLKRQGSDINIYVQNVFMYLDSILCNIILLIINKDITEAFLYENIVKVFQFKVLVVMINNAAVGIVTSFFLKTLNSILKTFASALELGLTAVLCYLIFGIPIYLNTVLAITTVMFATYLYSQSPVHNPPKPSVASPENEEFVKNEVV